MRKFLGRGKKDDDAQAAQSAGSATLPANA
jgi:hypothetical protein